MSIVWGLDMDAPARFEFVEGETALSSGYLVVVAPLLYLAALCAIKRWAPALPLRSWVVVHNAWLSLVSAWLFAAMCWELGQMFWSSGFWSVFCDEEGRWQRGPIVFYLYINYLLKWVELADTFLLALRSKPTPFLHVYHHAATLVLCLTQLLGKTCLQWFVVVINLFVHIVMYAYYALQALGYSPWWKRYLTMLQIGQFVVVLVGCTVALVPTPLHALGWTSVRCQGNAYAQSFGYAILASYLALFVRFFRNTYPTSHSKKLE